MFGWHLGFSRGCGKACGNSHTNIQPDPPTVFTSNRRSSPQILGRPGVRGYGPGTPGEQGGPRPGPAAQALVAAGQCVGRAGLFGGAFALNMSVRYRGVCFGAATIQLGGGSIQSF